MKFGGNFEKRKEMKDPEKQAKLRALKEAHSMASDMMKGDLSNAKGMQKVTVASDSKEGLEAGLELAKKKVEGKGELEDEDSVMGEDESDQSEGFEDQQDDSEPMDEEELDEEIKRLLEMKAKLENK